MLEKHLQAKTAPKAEDRNIVYWEDYRVTVLGDRLFRMEKNRERKYRDEATQAVWFRDMPPQNFTFSTRGEKAVIQTGVCKLILSKDRGQVCVEVDKKRKYLRNEKNLLGTYRTLDNCNGDRHCRRWIPDDPVYKIALGNGVCSKTGVAVYDDAKSYTLGADGEVKNEQGLGSDEYIFAYGDDYRGAVQALFAITGKPPIVPRFALGNWWSRYHVYTDEEYLRVLNRFEEREIPLSVATVDMDWHYSETVDEDFQISVGKYGGNDYVGDCAVNLGWTGYTWNKKLFPDPKSFLRKIKEKGLKITLNLHPSDGVRWWEDAYEKMANAVGRDASTKKQIPFDFTDTAFINAYFEILHRPYEEDGVDFWWIDWQQPNIEGKDGRKDYDPLWALNHYHYLDNAYKMRSPLILSRYAGVGSHRYPLGFSGDTEISWETLAYLPYFTATASNIGYTWWSHDIGGHNFGEKSDELYVRHVQYGVFSPVNRLHSTCDETMTKEPWFYGNGAGKIAEEFLRFRHQLIPYLYTASYRAHTEGIALVEPLYYQWKQLESYLYPQEYLFGSELLIAPVTTKRVYGFAQTNAWLPEGCWTDIFTGDEYHICRGGKKVTLLRDLDSLPVLAKGGAILPLSADKGNGVDNPKILEIWSYLGDGEYTLYEDGLENGGYGELFTEIVANYKKESSKGKQILTISSKGNTGVIPTDRILRIRFKNVKQGKIRCFEDGVEKELSPIYADCATAEFGFSADKQYRVEVEFPLQTRLEKWKDRARDILTKAEGDNTVKIEVWKKIQLAKNVEGYLLAVEGSKLPKMIKKRLKETL